MKNIKPVIIALALTVTVTLSGCSTINTLVEKRNLSVESKMSNSVFLEPVSPSKKTVFIQLRNVSDQEIDIKAMKQVLIKNLTSKSYTITDNPDKAYYIIQQNILSVAKTNQEDAYNAVQAGFGGAVTGSIIVGSSGGSYGVGGLVGGAIGIVTNALVKDVYFNLISDIQIKEKTKGIVSYTKQGNSNSGSSLNTNQQISGQSNYLTHSTRIVSVANQVNLEFHEAQKLLEDKLIKSVAGIF